MVNRLVRTEQLECPICLHTLNWRAAKVIELNSENRPVPFEPLPGESEAARRQRLANAYRVCPGAGTEHYLPFDYGDYHERIVVGMIGGTSSGKTHLLAAIISQLMRRQTRLRQLGLQIDPLDLRLHQRYMRDIVDPFIARRQQLPQTELADAEFADALRVTNQWTGRRVAVTFFDVAGEVLAAEHRRAPFVGAINALMFVLDPESVAGLTQSSSTSAGDAAFDLVFNRLNRVRNPREWPLLAIPAAVVVAKADLVRFRSPLVSKWLSLRSEEEEYDLTTVERESEDAYAFLSARGAQRWLVPFERCAQSTLHFASATNVPVEDKTFPQSGFAQRRVLKPFLSLLAMKGVIAWQGLQTVEA